MGESNGGQDALKMEAMRRSLVVTSAVGLLLTVACSETPPAGARHPLRVRPRAGGARPSWNGNQTTAEFTVSAPWELGWSYQCGTSCTFVVDVKTPSGEDSSANPRLTHTEAQGQGVAVYHAGGTFFLNIVVCCAANSWAVKVVG